MIRIKISRVLTDRELQELNALVENQKTTDKYVNTSLHIDGDNAVIDVDIDEDGDITVL